MTNTHPGSEDAGAPWTPLYRADLEALLEGRQYTIQHLTILSWLIWLSLLSAEELLRALASEAPARRIETRAALVKELKVMTTLGLIDAVTLREPGLRRQQRYYVTDLGLYLYLSAVHTDPPLSIAHLAQAYPVDRDDLWARLARPEVHLVLSELVSRLLAEGTPHVHLVSYQQPWLQMDTVFARPRLRPFSSDAALLIQQATEERYAFLVQIDTGSVQKTEREVEKWVDSLFVWRQHSLFARQDWPELLIISTPDRFALWSYLLRERSFERATRPLSGGMTTLEALQIGILAPIWWDLVALTFADDPAQLPLLSLEHLLRHPASVELVEHFSRQQHLYHVLLKETASPPKRLKQRLARSVGDSLQEEAAQLTRAHLDELFAQRRTSRESREGAGLLTLWLTLAEKEILSWAARHPLLDILTLQALLRPQADPQAIKPLQQKITHLFQQGLLETRLWSAGFSPLEQQRYLLTPVALKYMATRHGVPFGFYLVPPRYLAEDDDDEQRGRQWGTKGLDMQRGHTNGLYTFVRQLYKGTHDRGEILVAWKSAHEAVLSYRDTISQQSEDARPDAELVFARNPHGEHIPLLLEYDRGTTGEYQYFRKFKAYLDYQQATGRTLPLLVIVTPSRKAAQLMQRVLSELSGTLRLVIILESELLAHGLTLVLRPVPP